MTLLYAPHPQEPLEPEPKDTGPTPEELYQEFLQGVRPMVSVHDLGVGLSDIGIAAARSTARIAARARKIKDRWRGNG